MSSPEKSGPVTKSRSGFRERNAVLFDRYLSQLFVGIRKNSVLLGALGLVLVVIVLGAFGFQSYRGSLVEARQSELAKILSVYFDEKTKNETKLSEVDSEIAALTDKEKDEAKRTAKKAELEAKKAGFKTSFAAIAEPLKQFKKNNAGTVEATLADSILAEISMEASQAEDARALLESVVTASKKLGAEALTVRAQMNLVQLDITDKKYAEAVARVDEMLKSATDAMKPTLLLLKVQAQFLGSDLAAVKTSYEEMQKSHADAQETKQARVLLSLKSE